MNRNQKRIAAVISIILVVFTVISFAVPFEKNSIFWFSWIFGVIAIAMQLYVMKIAFHNAESVRSKFYGFPIARIGIIYMIMQLVLSVLFMALAEIVPIWIPVILYVVLLGGGLVGFIGTDAAREEIEKQDIKIKADTSCIMTLRSTINTLSDQCHDRDSKKALTDLADEFRYSDPVSNAATKTIEAELESSVSELKKVITDGTNDQVMSACRKVSSILAERNMQCKLNKGR